jgi:hypothetical protein
MWPFDLAAKLAAMTKDRDVLLERERDYKRQIWKLEERVSELAAQWPNGGMDGLAAWDRYHEDVEREIWRVKEGDPSTHRDDKAAPMLWEARAVFVLTWNLKRCPPS